MEYQVKTIASKDEIESCERFEISNFMWTCLQQPRAWGWMGYLEGEGFYVKLVCEEKNRSARLPTIWIWCARTARWKCFWHSRKKAKL